MKKFILFLIAFLGIFFVVFALGPRVKYSEWNPDVIPTIGLENAEKMVEMRESKVSDIKPGNRAKIIWSDTLHQKTPYSIVYLHGFSASHEEGNPVHINFAKRYGCNLYLSRFKGHGRVDTSAFKGLTPQDLLESAEFAIEIGKAIGEKVILMNCSSGATPGIYLAAGDTNIVGIINYSPNIDIYGSMDELLLMPWGKFMAKQVMKGDYRHIQYSEEQQKYWNAIYHMDGVFALKSLIQKTMHPKVFQQITQPVFLAYYYKDEDHQDMVVSVDAMLSFFDLISTPEDKKRKIAFENGRHVMSSHVIPSEATEALQQETFKFAEEILQLKVIKE